MKMKIHSTGIDRIFIILNYLFLTFCLIIVLYPLIFVVSSSFSDPAAVATGRVILFPVKPTLRAYQMVFNYRNLWVGFRNSFYYMIAGTGLSLFTIVLAAFPLSRKEFFGRNVFTFIFAFTMYFSGGLIPTYLLINSLGMLDTRAVMIIPGMVNVWYIIMCRTYFTSTIPDELFEASQIDGCGEFKFLLKVVLPLSTPIMAVLGLYTAVGIWNSYFGAMIYLNRESLYPLQLFLRSILLLSQIDLTQVTEAEAVQQLMGLSNLMKYAVIVVASVPVMILYPFVQRYFVKGVMIGAIKG